MAELTKASTSRTIQTKSGKVHYQEAGEGYPLILMHGSGAGEIVGLADHQIVEGE
mgnify:CR=1 FL=1